MPTPRSLLGLLSVVGLCVPAAATAQAPAAVNPETHPVLVRGHLDRPGLVELRVADAGGRLVARSPQVPAAGPIALRWAGRDASGAAVRDGRYTLSVLTAAGDRVVPDRTVTVDRTPPRVALTATATTRPTGSPRVRIRVGDAGSPDLIRVRLRVEETTGRRIALGRWRAPGRSDVPLPGRLARRSGPVMVVAEARDAAGNTASSRPRPVVLAPAPGAAHVVRRVSTSRRAVALTIDDGARQDALASMLTTLERERATATFCLNGSVVAGYASALVARLRAAARRGRALPCDHGWSHRTGARTSVGEALRDLGRPAVGQAFGMTPRPFYRPPYGEYGPGIMSAAGTLRYRSVLLWDVDTNDWQGKSPGAITSHVLQHARAGSIVLLHVLPQSASALPAIIRGLRARGLEPIGVGDLIASGRPTAGW